jgi:hypothetical protein
MLENANKSMVAFNYPMEPSLDVTFWDRTFNRKLIIGSQQILMHKPFLFKTRTEPLILEQLSIWQVSEPSALQFQWASESCVEEVADEETKELEHSVEEQEDDAVLAAAQAVIEKRMMQSATKNVPFDETANRPFTGNPANRPTPSSSTSKVTYATPPKPSTPTDSTAPKVTPPTIPNHISNTTNTQYSLKTPVEDSKQAQELYDMIMNTPIPGVTPRHILATSPDVRKLIKEDTTTRKVPTSTTASVISLPVICQLSTHSFMKPT